MKKYPDHLPATDEMRDAPRADALEFPVASNFISRPSKVEIQTMLRRIEENMPWRNSRPGEATRRLAEKIPIEFVL
jgi:hypothetical protein